MRFRRSASSSSGAVTPWSMRTAGRPAVRGRSAVSPSTSIVLASLRRSRVLASPWASGGRYQRTITVATEGYGCMQANSTALIKLAHGTTGRCGVPSSRTCDIARHAKRCCTGMQASLEGEPWDGATARKRTPVKVSTWSHTLDYKGTKQPVFSLLRHVTLASRILPGQHGLSWIWSVALSP